MALYAATPRTLAMAAEALAAGKPEKRLQFLSHHFGLPTRGQPRLNELRRLQGLEPYLHLMDRHDLDSLADVCNREGWRAWRREHLDPRLHAADSARHPAPTARLAELDRLAAQD